MNDFDQGHKAVNIPSCLAAFGVIVIVSQLMIL